MSQTLARHEDAKATINVYVRAHDERLRTATNDLEKVMMAGKTSPIHAQSRDDGLDNKTATANIINGCEVRNMVGRRPLN